MPVSSNSKRGLGRGFESLIPVELLDESFDPTASQDQQVSDLRHIKIDEIVADPDQPRRVFDEDSLADLATSVKEHGVLQPIIVAPYKGGYKIVAGERRYRASKIAGVDKIPALVRTLSDQHKLEISLIENLQREDLNVMETATAYAKLRDQFNLTLEDIGKRVGGRSVSAVSNKLRLLKLPDFVQQALATGLVTEGQVRPLIGLDEGILKKVLARVIEEGWTSKKSEQFVVDLKKKQAEGNTAAKEMTESPYQNQIDRMQQKLNMSVKIRTNSKGAGQITIAFKNESELKQLQDILG
ncbi:ParB/RepB/Spo0J family partition protein [Candidatus Saccharibacteria bacterium]|nr:ParB/RepB/Spo0J family partition protein [Candidatus Saccharibacteria bacterium]